MTPKELTLLNNLLMGLNTESKDVLAQKLKMTRTNLLRRVKQAGRLTISEAKIIARHLAEVYGEAAVKDCFKIL